MITSLKVGGGVITGSALSRTVNNDELHINGGTAWGQGASIALGGKDKTDNTGVVSLHADDSTSFNQLEVWPNGEVKQNLNGTIKNVAMYEDVIPRRGGAVMTGGTLGRNINDNWLTLTGGMNPRESAGVWLYGTENPTFGGQFWIGAISGNYSSARWLAGTPDGTLTWRGQPIQYGSDQRLKQQITEIDDKLLDAWEDVEPVQFKYNDAVEQKGDTARLHTGYVVQQIDEACKSHNLDISAYGLYCHEEYPEETEEVEVEQEDGTKIKERKVIRKASEHYSLRYTETLVVECAFLRREVSRLKQQNENLDQRLKMLEQSVK